MPTSPLEVLAYDPWFAAICWLVLAVAFSCLGGVWRGVVMATISVLAAACWSPLMIVGLGAA